MNPSLLRRSFWGGILIGLAAPVALLGAPPDPADRAEAEAFFEAKIRPVLADSCLRCHGGKKVRGGLRLDSPAALLEGGKHGPALVPGDPDRSLLIQAIRHVHEDIKMPPGEQLPDEVLRDFTAWVKGGALWPKNAIVLTASRTPAGWAFEPVRQVEPPADPSGWSANPIDHFIRARQRNSGLQPAPAADKRTLLRRVTFDLTGLPPAPAEVDAFLADSSPDAWGRVVDRLLASPRYAECWGRHWLDLVRYADTGGFETDLYYPEAWRYRDYVIRALAADKPFDRFLQEQVAGDELWPDDKDAVQATALYCVGPALTESAMIANQLEHEWLTDAADTTGAAFLGLTLGCARCHDHKYDPITQQDYYALQAVFAASDRPYPDRIRLQRLKALNGLLSDSPVPKEVLNDPRCTVCTEKEHGFRLFHRTQPLPVHRLRRGELNKPEELVSPGFPSAVVAAMHRGDGGERRGVSPPVRSRGVSPPVRSRGVSPPVPASARRAALAQWLTAPDNPLTARVLVNRVWGWHFGQGIVRTPSDFGAQGEQPTHPELLDWLARDFIDHGWSLKRLHRLILLSNTYQMQSVADGRGLKVDAEDRLLWHAPRRRLEGEAIRDTMLACAGTLNLKQFGAPVVPPLDREELTGLFDARGKWPVTKDPAEHARRSVYVLVRRTFLYPLFAAFDPPEVMTSCPRRLQTVVPAQALTLLNSPLARAQAQAFARRLTAECGAEPEALVARAWLLAFGRPVTAAERARAVAFLHNHRLEELCLVLFNTNEFVYVD